MNKSELNKKLFDTVLKAAMEDEFLQELEQMPEEKLLRHKYEPSPRTALKIRQQIRWANRRELRKKLLKFGKRAAVIVAVIIPIVLGSLMSVEASRNAIFNSVMDWKSDHVDIYFQQKESSREDSVVYKPQYIPDGFVEKESAKIGKKNLTTYQNNDGRTILIEQTSIPEAGKQIKDIDNSKYQEISINGQKAYLFVAKAQDEKSCVVLQISKISFKISSNIDQKELIKIAKSIHV